MPSTERTDYLFRVSEFGGGIPFVSLEPRHGDLSILKNGLLAFDLQDGATYQDAEKLVDHLNEMVETVAFTDLSDVP
jgi:hypothetical protein